VLLRLVIKRNSRKKEKGKNRIDFSMENLKEPFY
jgi:hypothetical protein